MQEASQYVQKTEGIKIEVKILKNPLILSENKKVKVRNPKREPKESISILQII